MPHPLNDLKPPAPKESLLERAERLLRELRAEVVRQERIVAFIKAHPALTEFERMLEQFDADRRHEKKPPPPGALTPDELQELLRRDT